MDEQNVEKQFTSSEIVSNSENYEMIPNGPAPVQDWKNVGIFVGLGLGKCGYFCWFRTGKMWVFCLFRIGRMSVLFYLNLQILSVNAESNLLGINLRI